MAVKKSRKFPFLVVFIISKTHLFNSSKRKRQKSMFNECFYIDKDKAEI